MKGNRFGGGRVVPAWPAVVAAAAELDVGTAGRLRAALLTAFTSGHATVVLDLTATTFCDCTGLGVMIWARNRALAHGGELRLLVPGHGNVPRLLSLTSLDRVLPQFTSLAAALTPGRRPAPPGQIGKGVLRGLRFLGSSAARQAASVFLKD